MKNYKALLLAGVSLGAFTIASCDDDRVVDRNTTNTVVVEADPEVNKEDKR